VSVDAYFACREQDGGLTSMADLCAFLGFADRGALVAYSKRGPRFRRIYKRAKLRMEIDRHDRLIDPARFSRSLIFDLRLNYGWNRKAKAREAERQRSLLRSPEWQR